MKNRSRKNSLGLSKFLKIKNIPVVVAIIFCFCLMGFPGLLSDNQDQSASQRQMLEKSLSRLLDFRPKQELVKVNSFKLSNEEKVTESRQETPSALLLSTPSFPYVHPVMGPRKSSGFGFRVHPIRRYSSKHKGLDLAAPVGAGIRAMADGKVIFADPYAGYGKLVVIDHGNGVTTHYAHCDVLSVHPGQLVRAGQLIAEVGSSGMSTGPHLHLEVRVKGEAINPEAFFQGLFAKTEG